MALLPITRHAVIVGDYRYQLTRGWPTAVSGTYPRTVCWIMLNPSTADADKDDNTLRKIMKYTRRWGYDALTVVNLFAYRATDPRDLIAASKGGVDVVGDDRWIEESVDRAHLVVCGWGTSVDKIAGGATRARAVLSRLGTKATALRITQDGHPQHPLYLPGHLVPVRVTEPTT